MSNKNNIFDNMTNLYSLSKTLRFGLRPDAKTKEHLQLSGILTRDKERDEDYTTIKPLFDKLHDKFIQESLHNIQ
jgi:CRISPR-associated protein Cpf1